MGGTFVKRLIGLPGENVSLRNGTLFVDGRPVGVPYLAPRRRGDTTGAWRVPAGEYFALGDNREQSSDSREAGRDRFVLALYLGRLSLRRRNVDRDVLGRTVAWAGIAVAIFGILLAGGALLSLTA